MPQYGECEYWDERYSREPAAFDWYQGFGGLSAILRHVFPLDSSLLHVGVGSSRLQEEMARAGWRHIVNVDYSKVVIKHMAELHKDLPQLEYRVADVRSMPELGDRSFDGVLDKGTLDAILCGEGSAVHATAMVMESYRVLKPGGALMLVTYGDPLSRLPYLNEVLDWDVSVLALTKQEVVEALDVEPVVRPLIKGPYPATNLDCMDALSGLEGMHFVYICRKRGTSSASTSSGGAGAGAGDEPHAAPARAAAVEREPAAAAAGRDEAAVSGRQSHDARDSPAPSDAPQERGRGAGVGDDVEAVEEGGAREGASSMTPPPEAPADKAAAPGDRGQE
ncbi:hypothetical protein HYH02_011757 [Chlamydomonas schloesseri]|uniref:Methyltransferase type 11 domain-containing protein n=1 Tax=Chlamydomonas schloesseri TaxID=2026947 RepID=A0A835W517_9CHLO|nr:hypothetical protein HYH02_011757 [Chlamydomonas schloesseri]|eukprot:KAG2436046.1 hypothetical protein HYH02_011757 [Chlamydomonas schloesseri]